MLRSCVLVQRVAAKRSVRKTAVRKAAVTGATRIAKRFVTFGVHDSNTARFNPYKPETDQATLSAMDMINSIPPIVVSGRTAACDGGEGPLGHPRVFINTDFATVEDPKPCGYCGLRFVNKNALIEEAQKGRVLKQGVDYILPSDVAKYKLGELEDSHHGHH